MGPSSGESACKPDSVPTRGSAAAIYLGPPLPVGLARPTRDVTGGPPCPCLALLPVGFAEPQRSPAALVVSYTTVSPLPVPEGHRRSALCCTFHRVSPPGRYPAPCPVESGLSSMPKHRGRPANSLSAWNQTLPRVKSRSEHCSLETAPGGLSDRSAHRERDHSARCEASVASSAHRPAAQQPA